MLPLFSQQFLLTTEEKETSGLSPLTYKIINKARYNQLILMKLHSPGGIIN